MLKTNERLDKLAAIRVDFESRGMLLGSVLVNVFHENEDDDDPDSGAADGESWLPSNQTSLSQTRGEYQVLFCSSDADCLFSQYGTFPGNSVYSGNKSISPALSY